MKRHAEWAGTTAGSIGTDVGEIEDVMKAQAADIQKELDAHQSFESWGREGQELARRVVYLNGDLKVAASSSRRIEADPSHEIEWYPSTPPRHLVWAGRLHIFSRHKAINK